jgi:hypothetical protein
MTGAFCVYATAWLSLALWAAGEWRRRRPPENARGRALFTAALVVMVAHAALAFGVLHGWSHAEALLHAARRTQEVTGTAAPRGFYANHAFLAFWAIEAAAWWLRPDAYRRRPSVLVWLSRAVFGFMFVNGAVVFVDGPRRLLGAAALAAVAVAWARRSNGRRGEIPPPPVRPDAYSRKPRGSGPP